MTDSPTLRDLADYLITEGQRCDQNGPTRHGHMLRLAGATLTEFEGLIPKLSSLTSMMAEISRLERELAARNV